VIRAKDLQKVGDAKKFEGHAVAVTGKIELYNGKPQIVISSPEQIKVAEKAGVGETPGKQ
jgi:DNA/RNA endonuclease YhcR with UshA esterase domain